MHNRGESSDRQAILNDCFRDTTADAFRQSGIVDAASLQSDNYRVLEIGCGAGLTSIDLARQLPRATIVAIDANADLIANAKKRLELEDTVDVQQRIQFLAQNGESISQEWNGQFDAVWMRFIIIHVPDPISLVKAAASYLKPNGILLIEDCNAEGFVSNPPLYASQLLHEAHIEASLQLGADVRRGPLIGDYMKQAGMVDIECNTFVPLFGKGITVQTWCRTGSSEHHRQWNEKDSNERFELGLKLLRMSLDSLTPKFLEMNVCIEEDLERARQSLNDVERSDFQLFTIPGGQIFQWWSRKPPSMTNDNEVSFEAEQSTSADKELLESIVDMERHPLESESFRQECKQKLDDKGVMVMEGFLRQSAIDSIQKEGLENQHLAYYTKSGHNIYLLPTDESFPADHPRNRQVSSSKGCIQTDQIPQDSALRVLYNSRLFRDFLCAVLGEKELHEYADPLSSINLHYASEGQELNWHYDNSSFAITLLIQKPEDGGMFEYVRDVRDADAGDMNYELSGDILDGNVTTKALEMNPGTLVLFRGRNSMHRVTPVKGGVTRMLVVFAYNTEPGVSLSESARMTFFGRLS